MQPHLCCNLRVIDVPILVLKHLILVSLAHFPKLLGISQLLFILEIFDVSHYMYIILIATCAEQMVNVW